MRVDPANKHSFRNKEHDVRGKEGADEEGQNEEAVDRHDEWPPRSQNIQQ